MYISHEMYEDYLMHYGRRGMKWGRNIFAKAKSFARAPGATIKTAHDRKVKEKLKKKRAKRTQKEQRRAEIKKSIKPVKSLSEAELKQRINRLKLEREYKNLRREQMSEGRKFVESILKDSAKNIATQAVTYGMGAGVNKLAGDDIVNPKKGQKDK